MLGKLILDHKESKGLTAYPSLQSIVLMTNLDEIKKNITNAMNTKGLDPLVTQEFLRRVELVSKGSSGKIDWSLTDDLPESECFFLDKASDANLTKEQWNQLAMVKLNGGLGTSMGLSKAKSLIQVKGESSFLDIIREQTLALRKKLNCHLPVLLMNSFNTQADSLAVNGIQAINEELPGQLPADFLQNMVPRILQDSLLPAGDLDDNSSWCPPGHGDIFLALQITGALDRLIDAGYKVAFISNGDNLGATPDARILKMFIEEDLDWSSEVTPKTKADLKGGVLFHNKKTKRIELLETAQVTDDHIVDFQDTKKFPYFNINNLWVNLISLKKKLESGGLPLSLIVNPKTLNDQPVFQLETAMGAAIGNFEKTRVVVVPRNRFAPVKSCADLLVRRSDIYTLDPNSWILDKNPTRTLPEPTIQLSDDYKLINDFEALFEIIPSLFEIKELTITGKIIFDTFVTLKGKVKLQNNSTSPRSIKEYINKAGGDVITDQGITI